MTWRDFDGYTLNRDENTTSVKIAFLTDVANYLGTGTKEVHCFYWPVQAEPKSSIRVMFDDVLERRDARGAIFLADRRIMFVPFDNSDQIRSNSASDVNKTKFLKIKTKTKTTTGSKQRHFAYLTFKYPGKWTPLLISAVVEIKVYSAFHPSGVHKWSSHMGLADRKVCECNQGVEDHFFFPCTRYKDTLKQLLRNLCKNRGPTPDVIKGSPHWSVTLLLAPSYLGVLSSEQSQDILFATFDYIIQTRRL